MRRFNNSSRTNTWANFSVMKYDWDTFSRGLAVLIIGVMAVHILILCYFTWLKIPVMILYSLISVILYFLSAFWVRKGHYLSVYLITLFEVSTQTLLSTWMIGWGSGFYLYNIVLVPVVFYLTYAVETMKRKKTSVVCGSLFLLAVFGAARICALVYLPVYSLTETQIAAGYTLNTLVTFLLMFFFCCLFTVEVNFVHNVLKMENEHLDEIANVDPLTGLFNRRSMEMRVGQAVEWALAEHSALCVCMGDIDNFKKVNDAYGHECGDRVLLETADLIRAHMRGEDIVCRWGGEEFLILVPDSLEGAVRAMERIRGELESKMVVYDGCQVPVQMTFGIAELEEGMEIDDLIRAADRKLYEGKRGGKNRVVW